MKFSYFAWFWSLLGALTAILNARADTLFTHHARVEIALYEVDEKGKEDKIDDLNGNVLIDWKTGECSIQIKKDQYPCVFDHSEDITNSKKELVMHELPQIKLQSRQIDFLLIRLMVGGRYRVADLSQLILDVSLKRSAEFKLPFYECLDCENNGKDLRLLNAFRGKISRGFEMEHRSLGKKKLKFTVTLKNVEVIPGVIYIIGNDNATDFGQ
jgi:hypothetical protein